MKLPNAISMEPFSTIAEMFPKDGKCSTSGVVHELDSNCQRLLNDPHGAW